MAGETGLTASLQAEVERLRLALDDIRSYAVYAKDCDHEVSHVLDEVHDMAVQGLKAPKPEDECSCGHQRKDHENARCTRCFLPARQDWNHAFILDREVN